jgi:RNA polymerase sigma-70 factor (ECF subfamily)
VIEAFLVASRTGDFEALVELLDPDVVLRADRVAVASSAANQAQGAPKLERELHGQRAVAGAFSGRARGAQPALIDGAIGAAWAPAGVAHAAFVFTIADGKIVAIEALADAEHLRDLDLRIL